MLYFNHKEEIAMEILKITHELYEASKHWHLPLLVGGIGLIKSSYSPVLSGKVGEEVPGDNFLPREVLSALSSTASRRKRFQFGAIMP